MARISRDAPADWRRFLSLQVEKEERQEDLEDAIDFIDRLLVYDPSIRLTAREALSHRFITTKTDNKKS